MKRSSNWITRIVISQIIEDGLCNSCRAFRGAAFIPGIGSSDHGSFWKMGFRAVMVTDTAFYRNPNYHNPEDTIETLRFDKMSQIVRGLVHVVEYLTKAKD